MADLEQGDYQSSIYGYKLDRQTLPGRFGRGCDGGNLLADFDPGQCKQEDGTCDLLQKEIDFAERMQPKVAAKYKCEYDFSTDSPRLSY